MTSSAAVGTRTGQAGDDAHLDVLHRTGCAVPEWSACACEVVPLTSYVQADTGQSVVGRGRASPPARKMASEGFPRTESGRATSSRDLPSALTPKMIAAIPPSTIATAPTI